jgi:hypothetical protein
MQYLITSLLEVLNPTNTVSRNRLLSFAIGNAEAEIYNCLIAKHVYYNNLGKLTEGGWFYSTVKDLHLSSGYAEDAQKTAIRHLIKHGLIESELKGLPAKRYFRIIPDADKLASLLRSGEEAQEAIALKYDEELEKRKKRRYNRKHRLVEVTASDSVQSGPGDEKSKAVTNLNSVSGADDTDSARFIGNSGDISAENACSADYWGTRSSEARGKTKDNKNQSNCFSNLSFSPHACDEKFLNDGMKAESKLSFLEILSAMGLDIDDWHYIYTRDPTSEMDLIYVDEEERRTKTLHIPESLRSDRGYVLTALQYLSAYSNYAFDDDMKPMSNKNFIDITLKMLTEFIMADSLRFNGQIIGYKEVLDTLNSLIRENSLYDFILSFQYEWKKILREKTESSIRNKAAYMKVCLWDWLKRWKIEEYNQLVGLV